MSETVGEGGELLVLSVAYILTWLAGQDAWRRCMQSPMSPCFFAFTVGFGGVVRWGEAYGSLGAEAEWVGHWRCLCPGRLDLGKAVRTVYSF